METSDQEGRDIKPHADPGQKEQAGSPAAAGREKDLAENPPESPSRETDVGTDQKGVSVPPGTTGTDTEQAPPG